MAMKFTRQSLYDLVWLKPRSTLVAELGVSDVWLSKVCRSAHVPIPPRGYWAKVAAGKRPPKLALPPRGLGEIDEIKIGQERWTGKEERITTLPPAPNFPDALEDVTNQARKRLGRLSPPRSLSNSHPLIAALLQKDDERRAKAATDRYAWDRPVFDEPNARRHLKLLNALFSMLAKGGFRPTLRGKLAEEPGVTVGNYHVSFSLQRMQRRPRANQRMEPLELVIANWTNAPQFPKAVWRDTDSALLEDQLPEVAVNLVVAGEMLYRGALIEHYNWLVCRKAEQDERIRAAEEKAAKEAEAARLADLKRRRDALLEAAENRVKAANIRALVTEAEQHPDTRTSPNFLDWQTWAMAIADQLDPFKGDVWALLAMGKPLPPPPNDKGSPST